MTSLNRESLQKLKSNYGVGGERGEHAPRIFILVRVQLPWIPMRLYDANFSFLQSFSRQENIEEASFHL